MTRFNGIQHPSHEHRLKREYTVERFTCDGCMEFGIGSHYRCAICNFDLHLHCATASPHIHHPFFPECSFQFLQNPPDNITRVCDGCGRDVTGFLYHCKGCGNDLHPCCAKLPLMLDVGDAKLFLHKKLSKSCNKCGQRKRLAWSYRPKNKKYQLDVGCVKEMIEENWHEVSEHGGNGRLETRIPNLNNMLLAHHRNGHRNKFWEFAALALQAVIGLLLGDPLPLIAGVVKLLQH